MEENKTITVEQADAWSDFCVSLVEDSMAMFQRVLFTDKAPNDDEIQEVMEALGEFQRKMVAISNRMFFIKHPNGVKLSDVDDPGDRGGKAND